MLVFCETFWMPKAGNALEEYEDAFWPGDAANAFQCSRLEGACLRFAVADGATETSFSGSWARSLCELYGSILAEQTASSTFFEGLGELRQRWREDVGSRALPWYAEEKARSGAFSSILGLTLFDLSSESAIDQSQEPDTHLDCNHEGTGPIAFKAMAIGDSCFFHVRDATLIKAFPLAFSKDFDNSPFLIGSVTHQEEKLEEHLRKAEGTCQEGDKFYLMTDALAAWVLSEMETDKDASILALLAYIETDEGFQKQVQEQRTERDENGRPRLRNDDVTMVRLTIMPAI